MSDFIRDTGLFPHQIDISTDRVLLVALDENAFREASFLDARILNNKLGMHWADWAELQTASGSLTADAKFIFHIGHVGSTLISRLLGESSEVLALREPLILRQLAELKAQRHLAHSPWPPEYYEPRLQHALRWLSRKFRSDQKVLVKATSFASELANDVVADERKAIFLYLQPHRYIQTILAGENSRKELAILSSSRLERLNQKLDADAFRLWELDEIQRAAIAWLSEMAALEQASSSNVMWVDFDDFLAKPAEILVDMARFTGLPLEPTQAELLVSGHIMQQYSKAPEHSYSPSLREELLSEVDGERGNDINNTIKWLEAAADSHEPIRKILERGSGGK